MDVTAQTMIRLTIQNCPTWNNPRLRCFLVFTKCIVGENPAQLQFELVSRRQIEGDLLQSSCRFGKKRPPPPPLGGKFFFLSLGKFFPLSLKTSARILAYMQKELPAQ